MEEKLITSGWARRSKRLVCFCFGLFSAKRYYPSGVKISAGFTLPEVLITLAILGLITALILGVLITNVREYQWDIAKREFMSKFVEATRQMNHRQGLYGYTTTEGFVDALRNYLKIIQVCNNPALCFAPTISDSESDKTIDVTTLTTAKKFGQTYDTNVVGIILANGKSALLAYDPNCPHRDLTDDSIDTTSCISMIYDINGGSNPNTLRKDIYTLNVKLFKKEIDPSIEMVQLPGFRITKNDVSYSPIDTCSPDHEYYVAGNEGCSKDYWAGAKKKCDDMGMRLPETGDETNEVLNWCNVNAELCCNDYWLNNPSSVDGWVNAASSAHFAHLTNCTDSNKPYADGTQWRNMSWLGARCAIED
jgi:prepilin-type N-terminal cleavage/methylation domain-containing protein